MNRMQDSEIDQLFSRSLESFEVKPGEKVWESINIELKKDQPVRKIRPFGWIMAAASTILLIGFGFWLIKPKVVPTVQPKVARSNKVQKTEDLPNTISAAVTKEAETQSAKAIVTNDNATKKPQSKVSQPPVTQPRSAEPVILVAEQKVPATGETAAEPQIVALEAPVQAIASNRVEQIEETELAPVQLALNQTLHTDAANMPKNVSVVSSSNDKTVQRHKIHSVGDLVNLVVSKVDKRTDKVIEFEEDEDNESSVVSSFNLGFLKIKKNK